MARAAPAGKGAVGGSGSGGNYARNGDGSAPAVEHDTFESPVKAAPPGKGKGKRRRVEVPGADAAEAGGQQFGTQRLRELIETGFLPLSSTGTLQYACSSIGNLTKKFPCGDFSSVLGLPEPVWPKPGGTRAKGAKAKGAQPKGASASANSATDTATGTGGARTPPGGASSSFTLLWPSREQIYGNECATLPCLCTACISPLTNPGAPLRPNHTSHRTPHLPARLSPAGSRPH